MEKKYQILQLFSALDSQQSVNRLVEVCYKIALGYLHFNFRKVQNVISREGNSFEDIAIDSIASLFEKDSSGGAYNLIASFNLWQPAIKTEDDALFFINKIVAKRVEQHISMLLRESDPVFSKMLDSVNYMIKTQKFIKRIYMGRTYILPEDQSEIIGKVIPVDEFDVIPSELFLDNKCLIQKIFTYLSTDTVYSSAIPLNALVFRLKTLNVNLFAVKESSIGISDVVESNSIVETALNVTFQKLQTSYVDTGKLSPEKANIFRNTLMDMAIDLQDGGINPGLFKYLEMHEPGLKEEEYKIKYHNILEYLLKILKQNIADELQH